MTDPADFSWLRLGFACSVVLALMAAFAFALKYVAAKGLRLPLAAREDKRLRLVETLMLDTKRRVAIIRCDACEHLLLLGDQGDIVVQANLPPAPPAAESEKP